MIDKNIFCSSPWLHLRIGYSGKFFPCRWMDKNVLSGLGMEYNIHTMGIIEYFNSPPIVQVRNELLTGNKPSACHSCYYEDSFNKMSGRKKQLFRSNLDREFVFEHSTHYDYFHYSQLNDGTSNCLPIDLQIDLDNTCNSACIMCHPALSSRLKTDYIKLHNLNSSIFAAPPEFECWVENPETLSKFISEVKQLPIQYIHLLGGETLFVNSFYTICESLIDAGLAKNIILGTTTNGTIYSSRFENIISQFKGVHLGLSIESVNPLNDYIRYPSQIKNILEIFDKFLSLRESISTLHLELRITPNIFSIFYLDEVIQYMCDNNITAESCTILHHPTVLRLELLPSHLKSIVIQRLDSVIAKNNLICSPQVSDTRNPNLEKQVISNVAYGYLDFLKNMHEPIDADQERLKLVQFLKGFESLRNNSILDYVPEFTEFLIKYGYYRS